MSIPLRYLSLIVFAASAFSLCNVPAFAQGTTEVVVVDHDPPVITQVKFDDKTYFTGDIISAIPKISAMITDETAVATIEVSINSKVVYRDSAGREMFEYALSEKQKLKPGAYIISIEAWDGSGNHSVATFSDLKVIPNPPKLSGLTCFPNPFKPGEGERVSVFYDLSVNSQIRILIYNMAGDLVWSLEPKEGSVGGKKGYNVIYWNGRDQYNKMVLTGAYYLKFVSGNKVLGSAKILVGD